MGNQFAAAARARKVRALCLYFDVEFARRLNIDPIRQAGSVIRALRKLTQLEWAQHAVLAGQRPPSLESQAEVVAVYAAREFEADSPVASRRIGQAN